MLLCHFLVRPFGKSPALCSAGSSTLRGLSHTLQQQARDYTAMTPKRQERPPSLHYSSALRVIPDLLQEIIDFSNINVFKIPLLCLYYIRLKNNKQRVQHESILCNATIKGQKPETRQWTCYLSCIPFPVATEIKHFSLYGRWLLLPKSCVMHP